MTIMLTFPFEISSACTKFYSRVAVIMLPPGHTRKGDSSLAITSKTSWSQNKKKSNFAVTQPSGAHDWSKHHYYWVQVPFETMLPPYSGSQLHSSTRLLFAFARRYPHSRNYSNVCCIVKIILIHNLSHDSCLGRHETEINVSKFVSRAV